MKVTNHPIEIGYKLSKLVVNCLFDGLFRALTLTIKFALTSPLAAATAAYDGTTTNTHDAASHVANELEIVVNAVVTV